MRPRPHLSFRGAPESDVEAFESSLNIALPPDYREFLLTMGGGSDHPEASYYDEPLVLFRRGRRYISFALEQVSDQRVSPHAWERNTRTDWIRIGNEDGCTGCDPFLHVENGQVVLSDGDYEASWFGSFREMLFALGFYWLRRPGNEIRFMARAHPERHGAPGFIELEGSNWEYDVVRELSEREGFVAVDCIPEPSLAFVNDNTSVLFSHLFRTPIGSPHPELMLTSTDNELLERMVPRFEEKLIVQALNAKSR